MRARLIRIVMLLSFFCMNLWGGAQEDFFAACLQMDLAGVQKAVDEGADVNGINAWNQNALASSFLSPEITKYLLEKGCDPNGGSYPAIIQACNNYSVEVAKILLEAGADPNKRAVVDPGAGIRAAIAAEEAKGRKRNKAMIKAWKAALENLQVTEITALQLTVEKTNCVPALKLLLDAGADVNVSEDFTLLHHLATWRMSKEERVQNFATGAPNMEAFGLKLPDWYRNIPDEKNGTSVEMLELLLTKNIDINKPNKQGFTPLAAALSGSTISESGKQNRIDLAVALVKNGADPNLTAHQVFKGGEADWQPICMAAEYGNVELMKLMLEKGADINTTTVTSCLSSSEGVWGGKGYTPLIIAIMTLNFDVAGFLIEQGADLKIGAEGYTILEAMGGEIKATAEVDDKTPVYWAIEKNNIDLVKQIADKMTWKFNPRFSYKVITNLKTKDTGFRTVTRFKKGRKKIMPSSYADMFEFKEAEAYLKTKGL